MTTDSDKLEQQVISILGEMALWYSYGEAPDSEREGIHRGKAKSQILQLIEAAQRSAVEQFAERIRPSEAYIRQFAFDDEARIWLNGFNKQIDTELSQLPDTTGAKGETLEP